jgi:hypothetical protein
MTVLMWISGGVAAVTGMLTVAFWRQQRKWKRARTRQSFSRFTGCLQSLLERCSPGAVVAAYPNGQQGFLQVALTGRKGDWRELEFGLPDADWSRASFDAAVAALPQGASEWSVEHTPGNPDVPRFLRVWIEGGESDVRERATALLHRAAELLGFPADQTYNIDFQGTDHPDYLHAMLDRFERDPQTSRFLLRLLPMLRRHADQAERATKEASTR